MASASRLSDATLRRPAAAAALPPAIGTWPAWRWPGGRQGPGLATPASARTEGPTAVAFAADGSEECCGVIPAVRVGRAMGRIPCGCGSATQTKPAATTVTPKSAAARTVSASRSTTVSLPPALSGSHGKVRRPTCCGAGQTCDNGQCIDGCPVGAAERRPNARGTVAQGACPAVPAAPHSPAAPSAATPVTIAPNANLNMCSRSERNGAQIPSTGAASSRASRGRLKNPRTCACECRGTRCGTSCCTREQTCCGNACCQAGSLCQDGNCVDRCAAGRTRCGQPAARRASGARTAGASPAPTAAPPAARSAAPPARSAPIPAEAGAHPSAARRGSRAV